MPVVMIDFAFGLLIATVGVVAGWFLHSRDAGRHGKGKESDSESATRFAREVLLRLQNVAADVAAGVGEHTSRVEEINEELTASGDQDAEAAVHAVENLLKANSRMQEQLASADERLQDQAQQIQAHAAEARTDPLTGLANRRAFDDEMARRIAEFQRHGRSVSLMMVDVDHFKNVNDSHGHQVGDDVLRDLAKILRQTARETDTVARYGGEEFAAILPGTSDREAAEGAERFRCAIESHCFRSGKKELSVTASFGVAGLQKQDDATAIIARSDEALYAAKESGRNSVFWSDGQDIRPLHDDDTAPGNADSPTQDDTSPAEPDHAEIRPVQVPLEEAPTTVDEGTPPPNDPTPPAKSTDQIDDRANADDPADRICNRIALHEFLESQLRQHTTGPDRPSVVLVQVDNHADLVAELGDEAGQLILRATPQFLKAAFRDMTMLARYDTATYAIVLCGADLGGVMARAERLREAVTRCVLPFGSNQLRFTVSVSSAEAHRNDDVQKLLVRAEEALEAAAKSGGNSTYFHNGQWSETAHTLAENVR